MLEKSDLAYGAVRRSPLFLEKYVAENDLDTARRRVSAGSFRAFTSDMRVLENWLQANGVQGCSFTAKQLLEFANEQIANGKRAATVTRYISSIGKFLRLAGRRDTTTSKTLRARLMRIREGENASPAEGTIVLSTAGKFAVIHAMIRNLTDSPGGLRDRAILLLVTQAGFNSNQIVSLRFDDLDIDYVRGIVVQKDKSRTIIPWETGAAIYRWIECVEDKTGSVFRRIYRSNFHSWDGTRCTFTFTIAGAMTAQSVTIILRSLLIRARPPKYTEKESQVFSRLRSAVCSRSLKGCLKLVTFETSSILNHL